MTVESWVSSKRICAWEDADAAPPLAAGSIHLWWVPLSGSPDEMDRLCRLMSDGERGRAARYRFDRHRAAYIVGRGALRLLLSRYTGIPARQIRFEYGKFGKPSLAADEPETRLRFNYSDAAGYALYALSRDAEVGVDLEDLNREVSFERILRRRFSSTEADAILALPGGLRRPAFLACWTRKEGYGKAEGWGINYPLDRVEVCRDCASDRVDVDRGNGATRDWVIRQIYPSWHFVGTVVHPRPAESGEDPVCRYLRTDVKALLA